MILFFQDGCVICEVVEKTISAMKVQIKSIKVPSNVSIQGIPAFPALYINNILYVGEDIVSIVKREIGKVNV